MKNNRLKSILGMGFASVIQVLVNIVKVKIIAVLLGTAGVGITSFINNIITTIIPISSLGMNQGIIKEVSENVHDKKRIKSIIVTTYITTFILSIFIIAFIIIFNGSISILNLENFDKRYTYIALLSIPFLTFNQINIAIINGFKKIKILGLANIISSIVTLIISVALTYYYGLKGAVVAIFITSLVTSFVYWYLGRSHDDRIVKGIRGFYDINLLKILIKYSMVVLYTMFISNMYILIIRKIIISKMGIDSVGIFQADWSLINQYLGLVLSSLGAYLIPTLCSLKSKREINEELNSTLKIIMLIAVPMMLCIIVFGKIVIILFYSNKFMEAAELLPLFILGDVLKCIAWVIGTPLWTIPKLKKLALLNTLDFITIVGCTYIFIDKLGLYSVTIGYILMNIIEIIFNCFVMKKEIDFKFNKHNYRLILTSVTIVTLAVIVDFYIYNILLRYVIQFLLFLIWVVLSVRRSDVDIILHRVRKRKKIN